MSLSWRHVYITTIILRFFIGLSDSYIHPDEHFQSFEVLTSRFFGFSTSIPWEFASDAPARSFGPLYFFYGPLLWVIKVFGSDISPKGIWYLARLQLVFFSWLVTDMCLYRLLPTKPERVKAVFFTLTSYITLVYQSHCFSNSLETPLLLICLMLINDMRFDLEVRKVTRPDYSRLLYLGIVIALGIFNRVTFPAYLVTVSIFVIRYVWQFKAGIIPLVLGGIIPTVSFIILDTLMFTGELKLDNLIVTPLNNLIYNTNKDNLALHGIHPLYTHILINFPQIMGPLLVVLFYKGKNSYYKTVPFLSLVSGLTILSIVPHQELRFLVPLVPVACCCLDFNRVLGIDTENEEIKQKIISSERNVKPEKVLSRKSVLANWIIYCWYAFNIIMCILMGVLHQGGVVPALDYTLKLDKPYVQIWWRTYSPPSWMLGSSLVEVLTLGELNDPLLIDKKDVIIDAMGAEPTVLYELLSHVKTERKLLLVAPVASINCDFDHNVKKIWDYNFHLDLDHLNFSSAKCLEPGIGIYEII